MKRTNVSGFVTSTSVMSITVSLASTAFITIVPANLQAQQLEEIVVTAQRREQSLQEVPLSIETFTGVELEQQGFRNMEDLSAFSPSVNIEAGSVQDQAVRIRGFGTTGNSLTLEQAVPIFVDGIHFGRQSMIKTAFLDTAQVEVLKGPQPVFFGMNATAGAFNLVSRLPTSTWEGNVTAEAGNDGQQQLSFGVGGPVTDTLGIRLAGIKEKNEGFARHFITGDKIPKFDHTGGRLTLQWSPTEQFQATAKVELSRQRNGADVTLKCLTGDSLIYQGNNPSNTQRSVGGTVIRDEGGSQTLLDNPPNGVGWSEVLMLPIDRYPDCYESNIGYSSEGPYYAPPLNIAGEDATTGSLDIRAVAEAFARGTGDVTKGAGDGTTTARGHDSIDLEQYYLDLKYELGNGIGVNLKTAHVNFWRDPVRDNRNSGLLSNLQSRVEDFRQWSQELRFTSPDGGHDLGGYNIEWMTGFFWQDTAKDHTSNSFFNNVRTQQRMNWLWEDAIWQSAFATLTFNFMDDKASIDLGGRWAKVEKEMYVTGYAASYIFDVRPCAATANDDIGGGNFDPNTCPQHPNAVRINPATDNPRIYVPADMNNLWAIRQNSSRDIPSSWRSPRASAVGLTAPGFFPRIDAGPQTDAFTVSNWDPQITLRYRPNENHSLFFRFAQAFKAAGYDTGQTTIPGPTIDDLKFDDEKSETLELGSKGMLWDGRVRYDVTLFKTVFTDLQLSGAVPTFTEGSQATLSLNAGKQQVQGIEFGLMGAATDRLTLGLQGAIMDAELKEFSGVGCSFAEFVNTRDNLGISAIWPCTNLAAQTKDESGRQPAGTEDWKLVGSGDYVMPVLDRFQVRANVKGYLTSGYRLGDLFDYTYGDVNTFLSFGDQDETWNVMVYARNLLEPRPKVRPDRFVPGTETGVESLGETTSSNFFMKYGVQVQYNFQ